VEDQGLAQWRGGMGDPGSVPVVMGRICGYRCLGFQGRGGKDNGEEGENQTHWVGPSGFQFTSLAEITGGGAGFKAAFSWNSPLYALDLAAL
jgi:hypothetical protein